MTQLFKATFNNRTVRVQAANEEEARDTVLDFFKITEPKPEITLELLESDK